MVLNFTKTFKTKEGRTVKTNFEEKILKGQKKHTIRADEKNRWHQGRMIHCSTGARSQYYNCFKTQECTGTQRIEISGRTVFVDDKKLCDTSVDLLAQNDGFDRVDDFWEWFDQYSPFVGKIIHWTGFRY